jgi:ubiquinone biosynthesis protein COQ9
MSDTPKKPRKKAAPKDDAPQAEQKDDQALREAVLRCALPHAAFDGFTDSVLEKSGKEAGLAKGEVSRLFEGGPAALVEFYSVWADGEMEKSLAASDLKAMKIRERIASAVRARLAALKPHKEAARRARMRARFDADPKAAEIYRAKRRESDRIRRARKGTPPRPNARIETAGHVSRPKGKKC